MEENTSIDAFVPEVWSKEIVYQVRNASIFASLVRRDYDGTIENKGDKVNVPLLEPLQTVDSLTEAKRQDPQINKEITINRHKYFVFRVEDIARIQANPDMIAAYAAQGGRGFAMTIDKEMSMFSEQIQHVGTPVKDKYRDPFYMPITDEIIKEAIQKLDNANVPETERYLIIPSEQKYTLLALNSFIPADRVNDPYIVRCGFFGQIYGVNVYMSRNLLTVAPEEKVSDYASSMVHYGYTACLMFHKEAFALCMQPEPRVQAAYDLDYLATSVVGDVLYGAGILIPEFAVQIRVGADTK
jgi:hypothetical protein